MKNVYEPLACCTSKLILGFFRLRGLTVPSLFNLRDLSSEFSYSESLQDLDSSSDTRTNDEHETHLDTSSDVNRELKHPESDKCGDGGECGGANHVSESGACDQIIQLVVELEEAFRLVLLGASFEFHLRSGMSAA